MNRQGKKAGIGGWLFLLSVLVAYSVVVAVDTDTAGRALTCLKQ
jgi:hypothetical protein